MVSSGDRHVQVWIKGSNSQKLRKAEKAAKRLLAETASPPPEKLPVGFQPRNEE